MLKTQKDGVRMQHLPDNVHFALVVLAASLASLLIFRARHLRGHTLDMGQRNLLATNFGFFTTLYTFFLGFAVYTLWQNYSDVETKLAEETDLLVVEYRLSHSMKDTDTLRQLLREYVSVVVQDEWPAMKQGRVSSSAADIYERIWREVSRLKPGERENFAVHSIMLAKMVDLNKLRHARLLQVDGNLYYPIWTILYLGVAFTIIGFSFSNVHDKFTDAVYMVTILVMIFANIYLVIELDRPFGGSLTLGPERFKEALATMRAISASAM
ncbi:MAG: DUF4239 domain-containing protein [Desulfovibrio sp.]|nr:DUF4239 domain-containing protein [Desulfovibrio sp.]